MTKLEWCRMNAPAAYANESDAFILDAMSSAYEKFCEDKSITDNQSDDSKTTEAFASPIIEDRLDALVTLLVNTFGDNLAFKGGYMLTKLMPGSARQTRDVDFSIQSSEMYQDLLETMKSLGDKLVATGIATRYTVKETIMPTMSGGMSVYTTGDKSLFSIDIGWHDITYGTTTTTIDIGSLKSFTIERMLSDKIIATLSRKRFRRVKDIYDIYCITNCFDFNVNVVSDYIQRSEDGAEWHNHPFTDEIRHELYKAYTKLTIHSVREGKELPHPPFKDLLDRFDLICCQVIHPGNVTIWDHITQTFRSE